MHITIIKIKVGITIIFAFTSGSNSAVNAIIDKQKTNNTKPEYVFCKIILFNKIFYEL